MSCDRIISQRAKGFKILMTILDCNSPNIEADHGYDPLDVSLSTSLIMDITSAKGQDKSETPTFETDGVDGQVYFTTPVGTEYFDVLGVWEIDITTVFASGTYPGESKIAIMVVK